MENTIQIIGIFVSGISAFAAVIALLLVWQQLRIQNRQMKFVALTQLHHEIIGPAMQQAVRFIYNNDSALLENPQSVEDLEKIELVLNTYDLIAHKVRCELIPEEDTLNTEWMVLLRIEPKLKPFILKERQIRGGVPYKEHFEWLVKRAKIYKQNHYPNCEPKTFTRDFSISN